MTRTQLISIFADHGIDVRYQSDEDFHINFSNTSYTEKSGSKHFINNISVPPHTYVELLGEYHRYLLTTLM